MMRQRAEKLAYHRSVRPVVTGVAGFIGSHLAEALIARGDEVLGIDSFTPYYSRVGGGENLGGLLSKPGFSFLEEDLGTAAIESLLDGADVVFHQAAQPGVRLSWSDGFPDYTRHNVLTTQRLLEAARSIGLRRLVYASSSSVYGEAERYPTTESDLPRPASPYGVTKLAAEHLCNLYAMSWGIPTVSLRYFTVYGPRQRPDMAFHRLIEAGLNDEQFPLYGAGDQIRDFTYVSDVVQANLLAGDGDVTPGTVLNVSGGASSALSDAIRIVEGSLGTSIGLDRLPAQPGDIYQTGGANDRAKEVLGWKPAVSLEEGLSAQVAWHRDRTGR
jgi:nucleoside-diphosphate-sugar epimerase